MNQPRGHRADTSLILLVGILLMAGLVVIYSISPILSQELLEEGSRNYFAYAHLVNIAVGVVAFAVAARVPLGWWRRLLPWLAAASALFLVLMLIPHLGVSEGGATRWLGIEPFTFQPVEVVKFTMVIGAAAWFSGLTEQEVKRYTYGLGPVLGALGLIGVFVLLHQKDLGSMLVIAAIATAVLFASGVQWRQMASLLGAGAVAGALSILLVPHRLERLRTFFDPEGGLAQSGYHLHQALIAIGSGGVLGVGLGNSVQVYGYLPEAANDSIFAIIGETFGLVGALAVLVLFGLLIYRCLVIALRSEDAFASYIVLGVATWIGVQAFLNIAAMIGVVPLTGITLPLVSYGGTSLISVMLAMGVVTHISKYTNNRTPHENRSQRRRQRRSRHAHSGRRPPSHRAR